MTNNTITRGKHDKTGIRYISFGTGPRTLVVVPGLSLGFVTDTAELVADSFAAFAADYTVYLFDIREVVPEGYTIAAMCNDLVAAITDLCLEHIYLYGCSMGGMQSLYIAGTHLDLVEKVAVASSACSANETSAAVIGGWIDYAKAGARRELTASMGSLIYSKAFYEANKAAFEAMGDALTDYDLARFVNTATAAAGVDIRHELAAIKCPVLVLGSEGDQVLTPHGSREIAEITGADMYLYGPEQPHAVYDEVPDFKDRVRAFYDAE